MESEVGSSSAVGCISKKRKLDETNDSAQYDCKLPKLDSSVVDPNVILENQDSSTEPSSICRASSVQIRNHTLDSLPEYVLLTLVSYLNSSDLFHLALCNRRLNNLCQDKRLWYNVRAICDGRCPSHISMRSFFNDSTSLVQLSKVTKISACDLAETAEDSCFEKKFLESLKLLPNLKTFILENHTLNAKTLDLTCLPETITELRLAGTNLLNVSERQNGVFHNVNIILPNLEIVDVSFCQWLHPQLLFSLSKCYKIKTLVMMGCRSMKDIIPYASIAAIFGYQSLETLDMRLTYVGDSEIGCFNKIKKLKHILLEKPEDVTTEQEDESITDICTTNLGMRNWHPDVADDNVLICRVPLEGGDFVEDTLETLVVRNYPRITNITLKHAEKCLKSLKYLDVTGTSCSAEQIAIFKNRRPEVKLLHDTIVA